MLSPNLMQFGPLYSAQGGGKKCTFCGKSHKQRTKTAQSNDGGKIRLIKNPKIHNNTMATGSLKWDCIVSCYFYNWNYKLLEITHNTKIAQHQSQQWYFIEVFQIKTYAHIHTFHSHLLTSGTEGQLKWGLVITMNQWQWRSGSKRTRSLMSISLSITRKQCKHMEISQHQNQSLLLSKLSTNVPKHTILKSTFKNKQPTVCGLSLLENAYSCSLFRWVILIHK